LFHLASSRSFVRGRGEEEEEEEDILSLAEEKYRPAALEKMIALVALLVEQSRSER
jgi:ubiquitin carboxyl-terminal hydrolase 34